MSRRTALRLAIGAGALALDQVPRTIELLNRHSQILFPPDQQERLRDAHSVCLVFAPFAYQSAKKIAGALKESLSHLGPVGYVVLANSGVDTKSIARGTKDTIGIQTLHDQFGITELSFYGPSMGALIAGETFGKTPALMNGSMSLKYGFMEDTPDSAKHLDSPLAGIAQVLGSFPGWYASSIAAEFVNGLTWRKPIAARRALPGLLWDEVRFLKYPSIRALAELAAMADRYDSKMYYLTPEDIRTDPFVDIEAAIAVLQAFLPNLKLLPLRGVKGHANPIEYPEQHNSAINGVLAVPRK